MLNLTVEQIRTGWEPLLRGLAESLTLTQGECGVMIPRWMPCAPMPVPMAALFAARPGKGPAIGDFREEMLRCHFYGSGLPVAA